MGRRAFQILCLLLSGLVFGLDLYLPLGVAAAIPPSAVVLLAVTLVGDGRFILGLAALVSLFTGLGIFFSPLQPVSGGEVWVVATNRVLSLGTIWAVAVLGLLLNRERARRGRVDRELRRSLERTRAILETAVDAFVTIDERGIVQSLNPSAERMFGYASAEVVGENVKVLMPSPWREEHDRYIGRYLETGEKRIIGIGREVMGQRKDGTPFPIELAVAEARVGDERLFVGSIRDVSERKRLEEQFLQSQKMEAVGRLAGGVAHDFNTLLAAILGYSEMLLDGLVQPGADGKLQRAAQQIQGAAERGATLTRQLLTFRRPQPRQRRLLDLNEVVRGTREMLSRLVGEQIDLVEELHPAVGLVEADPALLEQVVMNLVVNAADAIGGPGRIVLRTSPGEATELPRPAGDGAVVLEVADTGHGMDEATRRRIFEPFYTTKAKGKGTGLGLSTVYAIVTQAAGSVTVVSAPGQGATFRVALPRAADRPAEEEVVVAPPPRPAEGGSETILLVEDDEMFRDLLVEVLEGHGYRVLAAASPAEAEEVLGWYEGRLDLLVTDLVMPGKSGYQLSRELREAHPGLKVILMSGYSDETLEERIVAAGDEHLPVLRKPFSTKGFAHRVREVLDTPV
ncbi:MAG TPA: PAS domain S-box protein [Thermoanaerobaculia bacterium]|nr:PAS domain S-box protein [Thermoanaerobaculia bacterium]